MRKLLSLLLFLFVSCSYNPLRERPVSLVIKEKHPWETEWNTYLPNLLVITEGSDELTKIHLEGGQRKITVNLPYGKTIYVACYPLGQFAPYGSAITPTGTNMVNLTQKEGNLVRTLIDIRQGHEGALSVVDYPRLLSSIESSDIDLYDLDKIKLSTDILNGEIGNDSFVKLGRLKVTVSALPSGRWVAESLNDESFWYSGEAVSVTLSGGLHCYLCKEQSLLLKIFVDIANGQSYQSVHQGPLW
ncbi:MAG: hypothetical protein WCR02_12790 [Sphaerochaetaceae bacterium]|jgi:hypothetical protein